MILVEKLQDTVVMKIGLNEGFFDKFGSSKEWMLFLWVVGKADENGECIISQNEMGKALNLSRSVVRRVLVALETKGVIDQLSTNQKTKISIKKSKFYSISLPSQRPSIDQPKAKKKSEEEIRFEEWMKNKFPRVQKMKVPLTLEGIRNVQEEYEKNEILEVLMAMDNYEPLYNNRNAKLTLWNWLRRRHGR